MLTPTRLPGTTAPRRVRGAIGLLEPATVDIVVPVYNEETDLERSVRRLDEFLDGDFPWKSRIVIVDNASTDRTWEIARRLSTELVRVDCLHLDEKGRGRALRAGWSRSDAAVVAYMDVDLSTDLRALLPLVAPLLSGHSDIAIGSRLLPGSRVERGVKRELISRAYNLLLHATLRTRFRDAQCGFKAVRAETARRLLPEVEDQGFFFDTELLVLAQQEGLRIHEVAVDWSDDTDSRVDIVATAMADLRGIARVWGRGRTTTMRQLRRFGMVGVVSTVAYVVLYAALRVHLAAAAANAVALVTTTMGNTAANRRLTFGVRGQRGRWRHHLCGLGALGVALAITTGAVHLVGGAGRVAEVAALVAANLAATVVRFVILRRLLRAGVTSALRQGEGTMAWSSGPS
jgi:glycosyltransferase involved in cell wall biosynthesis